jgi:tRNA (cmo5U34)-methyltransferase
MVSAMPGFEWDPDTYLAQMLAEIPGYEHLQEAVVNANGVAVSDDVLELGTGTGETALRVLARYPDLLWTGIDTSESMLARARERLPSADLRLGRLEDDLPSGPFDLVVSVLAIHHLDEAGKRDLFRRVAAVLRPGGQFILGDLVVPEHPEKGAIFVDWVMDLPSSVAEQIAWLAEAGFDASAEKIRADLAVFHAKRHS